MKSGHLRLCGLLFLTLLSGCATTSPTVVIRGKDGAKIRLTAPSGWHIAEKGPSADCEHAILMAPNQKEKSAEPEITVDYFDRTAPGNNRQDSLARTYLLTIRSQTDEKVSMEKAGFTNTPAGTVSIYRFHSSYYGEHLAAFLPFEHGHALVELWTTKRELMDRSRPAFEQVCKSVTLK